MQPRRAARLRLRPDEARPEPRRPRGLRLGRLQRQRQVRYGLRAEVHRRAGEQGARPTGIDESAQQQGGEKGEH